LFRSQLLVAGAQVEFAGPLAQQLLHDQAVQLFTTKRLFVDQPGGQIITEHLQDLLVTLLESLVELEGRNLLAVHGRDGIVGDGIKILVDAPEGEGHAEEENDDPSAPPFNVFSDTLQHCFFRPGFDVRKLTALMRPKTKGRPFRGALSLSYKWRSGRDSNPRPPA